MQTLVSSGGGLHARYEQLKEEYGGRMTGAGSNLHAVREVLAQRDEALRVLIDDAQRLSPDEMNLDDCVAIATCHELLRQFDKAIAQSERAVAIGPSAEAGYFPLVRSLLNIGQLRRAESVVRSAESNVSISSAVGSLRVMFEAATAAASPLVADEGAVVCEKSRSVR